jgi:hypothetical protein
MAKKKSKIDNLLDDLEHILETEWEPHPNLSQDGRLYHYTSSEGLCGILTSNELWLTQRQFMNDVYETAYATSILKTALKRCYSERDKEYIDALVAVESNTEQYILSLSKENDVMAQWAYYGGGVGYSIEFDESILRICLSATQGGKVAYVRKNQEALFDKIFAYQKALKAAPAPTCLPSYGSFGACPVTDLILIFWSLIKQEGNYCEKEFRFVIQPSGKITPEYRLAKGLIVPYIKVPFDKAAVKSITIGPQIHDAAAVAGLERFLNSKGYTGVEVKTSALNVRA